MPPATLETLREQRLAADAAPRACSNNNEAGGEWDADALPSSRSAHSAAGALTPLCASSGGGGSLPLSAALSLLNKAHVSPCASNASSRTCDQLRPIVARFLESLPSRELSLDAPSTIHSIADVADDADSLSLCSFSSQPHWRPPSASTPRPACSREGSASAAGRSAAGRPQQPQLAHDAERQARTPCALHSSARSGSAAAAASPAGRESTGSAPTPPHGAPSDAAAPGSPGGRRCGSASPTARSAAAGGSPSSRGSSGGRGVFVGNLAAAVSERELVCLFASCGRIDRLWIARSAARASLGYGFVVFDASDATLRAAQELDGTCLAQQPITVRVSQRF